MATKGSASDIGSKTEREQIAQRFREFMAKIDQTGKNLARAVGISDTTVSRYLNGHQVPESLVLRRISDLTDLNIDWLLTGKGEPLKTGPDNVHMSMPLPSGETVSTQTDRRRCNNLRQFISSVANEPGASAAVQEMLNLSCLDEMGMAILRQFVRDHTKKPIQIKIPLTRQ